MIHRTLPFQLNLFPMSDSENNSTDVQDPEVESAKKNTMPKKKSVAQTPKKKTPKHKKGGADAKAAKTRRRKARPYPIVTFSEATKLGKAFHKYAPGENKVRRLTLLEKLDMSPESSATKMAITNSGKYGITKGGYSADWIEITPNGYIACDPNASKAESITAQFKLAVESIEVFHRLYNEYVGKKVPDHEFISDFLDLQEELEIDDNSAVIDLFITNMKEMGLLRTIGGSEMLIGIEQLIDELPSVQAKTTDGTPTTETAVRIMSKEPGLTWDKICFYVSPIGDAGSDIRKHSDLFKSSIVEPAMLELGLTVVRADEIETAGMITTSILEHIRHSRLVIADLSLRNPNVYYEIALRHACRMPIVQIRKKGENIPFDVNQVNTITIDDTDLYTFVPQMESFKSEVASMARAALENPASISNPVTTFYPKFFDKD